MITTQSIKATLAATVVLLATLGQSFAITKEEAAKMDEMVGESKPYSEILAYAQSVDPDVKGFTGEDVKVLGLAMFMTTGAVLPNETASLFIDTASDDGANTMLVSLYGEDGQFIGAGGFGPEEIKSILHTYENLQAERNS